jgi:hypothetical protein
VKPSQPHASFQNTPVTMIMVSFTHTHSHQTYHLHVTTPPPSTNHVSLFPCLPVLSSHTAGDYDEALTQLSMCSDPDPLLLLRLYPQLVPATFVPLLPTTAYGEQLPDMQQQQQEAAAGDTAAAAAAAAEPAAAGDGSSDSRAEGQAAAAAAAATAAVSVVVPYLLSHRTRLLGSLEGAAAAVNGDSSSSSNARSRRQQQQPGSDVALDQPHDPPSTQSQPAVNSSSNGSSGGGSSANASSDGSGSNAGSSGGSSKPKSLQELRLLATVIDTAILRAMLLQPDSGALLRLLQQPNYVDLEDGEAVLEGRGRYAELAALYQYHRKHEKGLRLLQALSQEPGSLAVVPTGAAADLKGLPGVWAAVR